MIKKIEKKLAKIAPNIVFKINKNEDDGNVEFEFTATVVVNKKSYVGKSHFYDDDDDFDPDQNESHGMLINHLETACSELYDEISESESILKKIDPLFIKEILLLKIWFHDQASLYWFDEADAN